MKPSTILTLLTGYCLILLSACSFGPTMQAQFTSMEVGCDDESVIVTNESSSLNGEERWTAECNGKVYDCVYMPGSSANCYPRK
jgi:hypothetical protein